jgi:hypothetical protein
MGDLKRTFRPFGYTPFCHMAESIRTGIAIPIRIGSRTNAKRIQ